MSVLRTFSNPRRLDLVESRRVGASRLPSALLSAAPTPCDPWAPPLPDRCAPFYCLFCGVESTARLLLEAGLSVSDLDHKDYSALHLGENA